MEFTKVKPGTYLASYSYKDGSKALYFRADSFADAEARLQAIRETVKLDGHFEAYTDAAGVIDAMDDVLDLAKKEPVFIPEKHRHLF